MTAPSGDDTRARSAEYPGAPLWVKVFVAVLVALVLVFVLTTLFGAHTPMGPGGHGG